MTKPPHPPIFRYLPPQRRVPPSSSKIDWVFFFTLLFLVFTGAGLISFLVWLAREALERLL